MFDLSQQIKATLRAAAIVGMTFSAAACVGGGEPVEDVKVQTVWPEPPADPRYYFEQTLFGSASIVEESAAERFKRMATGEARGGTALQKPFSIAARDGVVMVSDTATRSVHVFDMIQKKYSQLGLEGAGVLAKPLELDTDNKGRVFILDGTAQRVVVYNIADGTYLGSIGSPDDFDRPSGLAVTPDGSRIFVVDTGGVSSENHRVVVFNDDGEHLFNFGERGAENGQFNLPLSAAMSPEGDTLYVVDGGNFRVQAFDVEGKFKFSIGAIGVRSGQFARPKGIAIDNKGVIFVSDAAFGNVQLFTPKGELLMWIGTRGTRSLPGYYMLPSGLGVDRSDGRLYFVDQFFRKVDVFRPAGVPEREVMKEAS